jgi:amino acid transporter
VIGTGVFTDNGQVLALAGPLGMLVGVVSLGLVAFCVGDTVSEFVQVFPAPNGIFEYIHAFVDEELAWVVAICYW